MNAPLPFQALQPGLDDAALRHHLHTSPLPALMAEARTVREAAWGRTLTYSRKVFIPLTMLCRDVCHYCTFAKPPRQLQAPYLSVDEVLAIARQGAAAGCKEALFTLGDKPELRYAAAREALDAMGFASTVQYLAHVAGRVLDETGLLPHLNPGVLDAADYALLKPVAVSMGLMLESSAARLCGPGQPHHGSPDKQPALRLASLAAAGEAGVAMTSGLLIGIGETRDERLDGLFALRDAHRRHGHLQEVIVQNFRAKPGTRMAHAAEPGEDELLWTLAAARLILDAEVGLQAPPNLNPGRTAAMIDAGLNDWGGISPVTPDHVNPEAPWPQIGRLAEDCAAAGHVLAERLALYPRLAHKPQRWLAAKARAAVNEHLAGDGLAREQPWRPGVAEPAPGRLHMPLGHGLARGGAPLDEGLLRQVADGRAEVEQIASLFAARGDAAHAIVAYADALRAKVNGERVSYVVNRNINYTNVCTHGCGFCAFSKSSVRNEARDAPYVLPMDEIARRVREAWDQGATEVCLQGGIHPRYTGHTYRDIVRAAKAACPGMHVHAFSPLEISHGARTLGLPLREYLRLLQAEGLASLPGTAAEVLADDVRAVLCPDKLNTAQWLEVVREAHAVGLRTTATIMFGHVDTYAHWAQHLLAIRRLQEATGGFTEFVPLPFVPMQTPIYRKGQARGGPSWREVVLMHAVSRIALHGAIHNIQCSWVKLGLQGATACLAAGANDIGGVLMNESISRAAGAEHGQRLDLDTLAALLAPAARPLARRDTFYGLAPC